MSDKKLFLLDGHALVYRAHYSFIKNPLINSKGFDTSAVVGFVRTLWDLLKKQQPSHIAVAFDLYPNTFRHKMYKEYKANRDAQPEGISAAIPVIIKILEAWKIPIVAVENYEADDVIGTLAKQAEKEDFDVYMVTPDKDYAQLVSDKVFMYKPSRQGNGIDILGRKEILEKWNIQRVEQVIDVLGLQGDSVDNIPGIPGIGPKTAVKLLAQFDSVEGIIANSDKLKGKQRERVEEFAEQGRLSKVLATIDLNVPIQFDADQYILEEFDREKLTAIFKELEFRSLATSILGGGQKAAAPVAQGGQQSLFGGTAAAAPTTRKFSPPAHSIADKNIHNVDHNYHLLHTTEERQKLIELLSQQSEICFDTETTGIDPNEAELVGMSFAVKANEAYYVPAPIDQDEAKALVAEFKSIFENAAIAKIGQNLKYDAIILKWYGIELQGDLYDTMIAHYLIEPELRHNMGYLAESYLKYECVPIESLIGKKGKRQLSMRDIAVEKVADYAAEDADITWQLKEQIFPKLKEEGFTDLYKTMEEPLVRVLTDIEFEGINVDTNYLDEYSKELEIIIREKEQAIYATAGAQFNISSPKQVGEILFDKLKIPYRWKRTKSGQYSTSEEKLAELAPANPVINDILKYRGLAKLKSTYVDALPKLINSKTGRIHSSFNQALTATGRLSSSNPNLQNIPIRTPEGRRVREAFIPRDKDHILLAADYSQIELRLIAEISGDEAMLDAFQNGQDIHRATAAKVFEVEFDEVTRDQRSAAKTVNFAIIYGAGSTNLSQQLDIPRAEAKKLIEQYFKQYSGLKGYMEKTKEEAREKGFVTTMMGRRRHLRDIDSRNSMLRSHAERNAINTPIQGTAADMIKLAMINVHRALEEGGFATKMILQVHDELVFDAPRSEVDAVKPIIEREMKNAIPGLKVPILVEVGEGEHWLEAH
ncbi:MAG: DNA polymerase I [Saprospiraceae bacterium]